MIKPKPLGYIDLNGKKLPITPLNNFFLNYVFHKKENWETLRTIVNIFLRDYIDKTPNTTTKLILGEIEVETQYKYLLSANSTRDQDLKIKQMQSDEITFVELQNRARKDRTKVDIEIRAVQYFGLGIGKNNVNANQVWILAEHLEMLEDKAYKNFKLKEETTNEDYKIDTSILFISLPKLIEEVDTKVSELAKVLLGETETKYEDISKVIKALKENFKDLKIDKEATNMMTNAEIWREEGFFDGFEQGEEQGIEKVISYIKQGYSLEEAEKMAKSKAKN